MSFTTMARTRKRPYDAEAMARAAELKVLGARQEKLARECGRSRCECCERKAVLVTWDERDHAEARELIERIFRARNPIWRICRNCYHRARGEEREG